MKMDFLLSTLSISFLILMPLLTIKAKSFTCNTAATCDSIIDYVTPNATTLSAISTLFDVGNHSSLLEANNLSLSTSPNQPVPVRQTTKIPFPCICSNGTGTSDRRPLYKVLPGDYLYHIAAQVFSGLVTAQDILAVHNIPDANLIYVGQVLWIPLPCSCDDVDGEKVVHYGHLVANGSTLSGIAKDYNTTVATLLKLNGMASPTDLMAGSVLDVPIKVDDSNLGSKKNTGKSSNLGLKMAIGIGAPASVLLLVCFIFCIGKFFSNKSETDIDVEAFIRQYGSTTPKIYKYSDIKNITNSFKEELGKGGYGNVYKGKLLDGRFVAVKVLNTSKGSGDEFINEVASIGKTFHVNVVTLLGFCYEGKKRALIYEFMPNGSLEKFIDSSFSSISGQHLGWEKLYDIALGIARGLDYLHRGCNTPILHLDIKPHNILLDEDLCPKISDFGLAKLNTRKGSMVSLMEARGTIGYIAPEVFSRNFGGVSHKSDVYSYGMMVLEMVGGRKNVDAYTSESYFPHWIYKRIELDEELSMEGEMSEEESEIARKMVVVGLWCIQTHPSRRPSISKVIEMLEGSIAALEVPPKPYLCSPRSGSNSSARPVSFSLPKSESDSFTT